MKDFSEIELADFGPQEDTTFDAQPVIFTAKDINPDNRARSLDLQEQTRMPVELIESDLQRFEREQQFNSFTLSEYADYPATMRGLSDPLKSPLYLDDAKNLSLIEKLVSGIENSWKAGTRNVQIKDINLKKMAGTATSKDLDLEKALEKQSKAYKPGGGFDNFFAQIPAQVAEMAPLYLNALAESYDEAATGAAAGITALGPGGAAAGLAIGTGYGTIIEMGKTEAGLAYSELSKMRDVTGKPIDEDAARGAAAVVGILNGALELTGAKIALKLTGIGQLVTALSRGKLKTLMKIPSVSKTFAKVGRALAAGSATEATVEALQEGVNIFVGEPVAAALNSSLAEIVLSPDYEAKKRLTQSAKAGAQVGFAFGGPKAAMIGFADAVAANRASRNSNLVKDLAALADESKTLKRSPKRFREHLQAIKEEHGISNDVTVPFEVLETYFQEQGIPNATIEKEMPGVAKALREAAQGKSDVAIPIEDFAEFFARSASFEKHLPDVRVHPELPTDREVSEIGKQVQDAAQNVPVKDQGVYEEIRAKLEETETPEVADFQARLLGSYFETQAEKMGITASELFGQYAIDFERQDLTGIQEEELVGMLQEGKVPTDSDIFGPSLQEFIKQYGDSPTTREEAVGRGYFDSTELEDITPAIFDQALQGEPQYAYGQENTELIQTRDKLESLQRELGNLGIDISSGTPGEIVKRLRGDALQQAASIRRGNENLKKFGLDPGKKYKTREIAAALEARQRKKYGFIEKDDRSDKARNKIARWMADEVAFELENADGSGVGWYSTKFQNALDILGEQYREIKTSQQARNTITALIAITSDGQKVVPNFRQAMEIYGTFRDTGRFVTERGHTRQASINNNLAILQDLYDRYGSAATHESLLKEDTISNLKKIAKENGTELNVAYQAHLKLPMAAVVFGPKLGAFYANLMGAHGYLTMDRWWSRSFNRYRGSILKSPTAVGLERFRKMIGQENLSDEETMAATVPYKESYEAKDYKKGTEIERAANTIWKDAFESLQDDPFNSTDRTFMLDATNHAQRLLKRRGHDMSIADIQAILWYFEKRLYGELGARQSADISYEEAAGRVTGQSDTGRPEGSAEDGAGDPGQARADHGSPNSKTRPIIDILRMGHGNAGGEPTAYTRGAHSDGGDSWVRGRFDPTEELNKAYILADIEPVSFLEVADGNVFHQAMVDSLNNNEFFAQVEVKPVEEYTSGSMKMFLTEDQSAGFAIKSDGDIVSIFATPGKTVRNFGYQALALAISQGGTKLDAFNTFLPKLYSRMAFVEDNRLQWSDEYQPEGWKKETYKAWNFGEPDVVMMKLDLGKPVNAADGATLLYQEKETDAPPKGYITMNKARDYYKITLTGQADLSTFLHESGHLFLELSSDLASRPGAAAEIVNDMQTIRKWLGVKPGESFSREHHEKFARGFEAYLMEGKAPSFEMKDVFARFRSWLVQVYKEVTALNVDLTDEVRGVMGRMLATDAAIRHTAELDKLSPVFKDAETAGMTTSEFAEYRMQFAQGMEDAEEQMLQKLVQEMQAHTRRKNKAVTKQIEAEVKADVESRPVYQLLHFLKTGNLVNGEKAPYQLGKLDRGIIQRMFPGLSATKDLRGLTVDDGGVHPVVVASYFGFKTADEMVQAITEAPAIKSVIKEETQERFKAVFGDSMNDQSLTEIARRSLHNDKIAALLTRELRVFGKRLGRPVPTGFNNAARLAAEDKINNTAVGFLQPNRYQLAEQRYGKKAFDAAAKNDWSTAAEAKRLQIINYWLYKKSAAARDDADGIRNYLTQFESPGKRKKLGLAGGNYLEAIDTMLDGIQLSRVPMSRLKKRKSLESYLKQMEADGQIVQIPDELRSEIGLKNFKQMTFNEFVALRDAVKNINHLAMLKNKLLLSADKRNFRQQMNSVVTTIQKNATRILTQKKQNRTIWEKAFGKMRSFDADLLKVEFLLEQLDGDVAGELHHLIFRPMAEAQVKKYDMLKTINKSLYDPLRKMPAAQKARMATEYNFLGVQMYGHEVMAVALNMGNEGNLDKLIRGYEARGYTNQMLQDEVDRILTKEDLDLVQHIWDQVNSFWPEIEALNQKYTGLKPPKVLPRQMDSRHGTYRGGYYPVVYDPNRNYRAFKNAQKGSDLFENNFMRPGVSSGFTEGRTAYAAPILLSLEALPNHLNEVIHYLTHYEAVTQVSRIINDNEFRQAVSETAGPEYYDQFTPWLQAIAQDGKVDDTATWIERSASHLTMGVSIMAMGFSTSTTMVQILGLSSSLSRLGTKWLVSGLKGAVIPSQRQLAMDKSNELRHTMQTFDRDARSAYNEMLGMISGSKIDKAKLGHAKVVNFAFYTMGLLQQQVNIATWLGAYNMALAEGRADPETVADAIVRKTQSGGGIKDLAKVQRHGPIRKLFTAFYTYFSALYGQLRLAGRRMPAEPGIAAAQMAALVLLPVFIEKIARDGLPDEEEPPEEWMKGYASGMASFGIATLPILRDVLQPAFSDFGYSMSPGASVIERGLSSFEQAITGDSDLTRSQIKNMARLFSLAAHLPGTQAIRTWEYFDKLFDGEIEEPIREFIFGVKRDSK